MTKKAKRAANILGFYAGVCAAGIAAAYVLSHEGIRRIRGGKVL